jgi:hypothetical protein
VLEVRLLIDIRSLTDVALCRDCRQSSFRLLYVRVGAPRCSHAGSCSLRFWDSFRGAKLILWRLADFRIESISLGKGFVRGPCEGGVQLVKKALRSVEFFIPLG